MPSLNFKRYFVIPSLLVILVVGGCASSEDTLRLDSVIQQEKERKERLATEAAQEKQAAEARAKAAEEIKQGTANVSSKTPEEIIAKAKARPEELEFLEIPDSMSRLTSAELAQPEMQEKMQKTFPDFVAGWRYQQSTALLLSGIILMQKEQLLSMTKEEFLESIKKVKTKYEMFYQKQYNAPMTFEVHEKGPLVFVRMTGKYLENDEWWTDKRLIYFYKPEHRLNILVTGKESDLAKSKAQIDGVLELFEQRLSQYYKEGIAFRKS